MAICLFRSVPKSGNQLIRPNSLGKYHKRNSSSAPQQPSQASASKPIVRDATVKTVLAETSNRTTSNSNVAVPLAVGVSLGLSVAVLAQANFKNLLFPSESSVEKNNQVNQNGVDTKLIEELISSTRKQAQFETQLNNLKNELNLQAQQLLLAQQQQFENQQQNQLGNVQVNIFELSQVIEANNLANTNNLKRELEAQRKALMREHLLKVEGEVLKVENKYRPVINRIKELEAHLEAQKENQQKEGPARILWISCQSLLDRMRFKSQGPLESDPAYVVLKQYAADNNQLAISVLDALPAKALKQGIESEESLVDRFSKVEKICKRVSMVDERGGGLAKYLVSYLQSLFIIDTTNPEQFEEEFAGRKLVDPTKWTTFDILARVRCCLKKHDLDLATRYANQLRGQARVVARDWIRDARIHLEVKEAFSVLSTYAEAVAADSVLFYC